MDNLFWSEEHLNDWLNDYPAYKRLDQLPAAEFLESLKNSKKGEVVRQLADERMRTSVAQAGGNIDTLPANVRDRVEWSAPPGKWRLFVFYTNSTEHFVMGGAFPGAEADARVVDHLSRRGADALLEGYAAPVVDALQAGEVRDVFVDSFEPLGELPFTRALLEAFEARAGYAATPYLPFLFRKGGESKYADKILGLGRYRITIAKTSEFEIASPALVGAGTQAGQDTIYTCA